MLSVLSMLVLAAGPPPAYADVAPILARKCCGCHQKGQAAPMPLGNYAEVAPWSESIHEAVAESRMPPWGADPAIGRWANDRSLTADERTALLAWLDAECPEGPPVANSEQVAADGWRIQPDAVFAIPEQSIPAAGQLPYQFVKVPTGFKEDVWITAAEVRPGSRKVLHHALVFAGVVSVDGGMLASYLPGDGPMELPPGYAKLLPAGRPIVFQLHYTATGRPETDATSIGLVFSKKPPAFVVTSLNVEDESFTIPAGAADFRVSASRRFVEGVELLSVAPHMHLRGKDFVCVVTRPGRNSEVVLSVPRYDFNWQTTYRFAEPLRLPAGSQVTSTAHFDNSTGNPNNPDPTQAVRRGERTTDEMMIGFVDYAVPAEAYLPPTPTPQVVRLPDALPAWCNSTVWVGIACAAVFGAALAWLRRRHRGRLTSERLGNAVPATPAYPGTPPRS